MPYSVGRKVVMKPVTKKKAAPKKKAAKKSKSE